MTTQNDLEETFPASKSLNQAMTRDYRAESRGVRRFEFVGGTSSKFWEVARAGTEVTVTFGRIGTAGQTQVKDLVTEAAAIKHLDTLVAEKVKKGYAELSTGSDSPGVAPPAAPLAAPAVRAAKPASKAGAEAEAPAPTPGSPKTELPQQKKRPAAPAEDVLVIPPSWRRSMDPRRGSANIPALNLDPARAKALFNETWSRSPQTTEMILKHPLSDAALGAEVRAFLGEEQKGWLGQKGGCDHAGGSSRSGRHLCTRCSVARSGADGSDRGCMGGRAGLAIRRGSRGAHGGRRAGHRGSVHQLKHSILPFVGVLKICQPLVESS